MLGVSFFGSGDFGLLGGFCACGGLPAGLVETGFGLLRRGVCGAGFKPGSGGPDRPGAVIPGIPGDRVCCGCIMPGIRGGGIIPGIRGGIIGIAGGAIGRPFSPGRNSAGISPGARG